MNKIANLMCKNNAVGNSREIANEAVKLIRSGKMGAPELEEILRFMYSAGKADLCSFMSSGVEDYQAELHFGEVESRADMQSAKEYFDKLAISSTGYDSINEDVVKAGMLFMSQFM